MGQTVSDLFGFVDTVHKVTEKAQEIIKSQTQPTESIYLNYVLKLQHGMFYVGRTLDSDLSNRSFEHLTGIGSEWTKLHPPLEIIEQVKGDKWMEDNLVYKYMDKYTIDNVRGGSYCQIELLSWQKRELQNKLKSVNNACYNCGKTGHFIKKCKTNIDSKIFKSSDICHICGKPGHLIKNCTAGQNEKKSSIDLTDEKEILYNGQNQVKISMITKPQASVAIVNQDKRRSRSRSPRLKSNPEERRSRSRSPKKNDFENENKNFAGKLQDTGQQRIRKRSPLTNVKRSVCTRCGNFGHENVCCFAKQDKRTGKSLPSCSRCSRMDHYYNHCSETYDVFGSLIDTTRLEW